MAGAASVLEKRISSLQSKTLVMECSTCTDRPTFLEPCPACGGEGTYKTHASVGFEICHGCEDKFCTECAYGARYMCDYFRVLRDMPPAPPKLERQINEVYWELAEDLLRREPALQEVKVEHIPGKYIYIVRRDPEGRIRRISSTEVCKLCDEVDIRREKYMALYDCLGQFVCEKCLHTIQCFSESSCSQPSSSSCICGGLASP